MPCWCGRKMVQPLWRTVLKKLNIELPYNLAVPLLGRSPKELKAGLEPIFAHPCYSSKAKRRKQPASTDRHVDEQDVVHAHSGIVFMLKKKEILTRP